MTSDSVAFASRRLAGVLAFISASLASLHAAMLIQTLKASGSYFQPMLGQYWVRPDPLASDVHKVEGEGGALGAVRLGSGDEQAPRLVQVAVLVPLRALRSLAVVPC